MGRSNGRGRRQQTVRTNQAYKVDSAGEALAIAGRVLAWCGRLAWRWRTELLLALPVVAVYAVVFDLLTEVWGDLAAAALAGVVLGWPRSRRLVIARLGCARSRRLILATLAETRADNSSGRLPLVLRSRTTPSGQRLLLRCRVGHSAELLEARVEELRAGARCRNVTITRDPNRSHRVTLQVIRRDTLNGATVASVLLPVARRITAVPAARGAVEEPGPPDAVEAADAEPEAQR
ncbi:MAG: hypothetical protein DLM59_17880 [Pseudonocardiales bacterium]|nr:MAG: hypothetical protein DLM59_17880 [Pseudonocardiales bacterium]